MPPITNAMKALVSTAINGIFAVLIAFDVTLTQEQIGAIMLVVNTLLAIAVLLTANASPTLATGANALTGKKPKKK
jgi:uncharacterized MnhB-related membrane protein